MVDAELHISRELQSVLPAMTDEEKEQLRENIKRDGRVTDPILYWWDGKRNVVVDGMNRYDIARRASIPFKTEPMEIEGDYEDVKLWMLDRQLGRRNLLQPAALRKTRGELFNRLKGRQGGDRKSKCQNVTLIGDAAQNVAEKAGVSARTVKRDGAFVEALNKCTPAVQKGISSGTIKATDEQVKTLSTLDKAKQDEVAADVRKHGKTVAESFEARGVKPKKRRAAKGTSRPAKKKKGIKALEGPARESFDARQQIKVYHETIGRWMPQIDKYREKWPGKKGDEVIGAAKKLFESLKAWEKVVK